MKSSANLPKIEPMAITYSTTAATTATQGIKAAIYGNSATGKTSSIATAPAPFIIAAEPGLLSLTKGNIQRMFGANMPGITYDIPVAKIESCADLRGIHAAFIRKDPWTLAFKTLALDSLSQIAEYELKYQMTQTPNGQKAYGQMADEVLDCIRLFMTLDGLNVIFTAKQAISTASGLYSGSFPGQLLDFHFPFEFDEIFQMVLADNGSGGVNRYFRTVSDHKNFAKDRSGALDPRGEFPNWSTVFNKISAVS